MDEMMQNEEEAPLEFKNNGSITTGIKSIGEEIMLVLFGLAIVILSAGIYNWLSK